MVNTHLQVRKSKLPWTQGLTGRGWVCPSTLSDLWTRSLRMNGYPSSRRYFLAFEVFWSIVKIKTDCRVSLFFPKPKWSAFHVVGTYSRHIWMNDLDVQASWQGHLSQRRWPAWIWLVQLAGRGSSSSLPAPPGAGGAGYLLRYSKAFLPCKEMLEDRSQGASFPVSCYALISVCINLLIWAEAPPPHLPIPCGVVGSLRFPVSSCGRFLISSSRVAAVWGFRIGGPFFWWQIFGGAASLIKQGNGPEEAITLAGVSPQCPKSPERTRRNKRETTVAPLTACGRQGRWRWTLGALREVLVPSQDTREPAGSVAGGLFSLPAAKT